MAHFGAEVKGFEVRLTALAVGGKPPSGQVPQAVFKIAEVGISYQILVLIHAQGVEAVRHGFNPARTDIRHVGHKPVVNCGCRNVNGSEKDSREEIHVCCYELVKARQQSEIPADFTVTIHLLEGIIVEGLADVSNRSVVREFITADYKHFIIEAIESFFITVVSSVAAIIQKLTVELEGSGKSLLGEVGFVHEFIMAQNATEVKGVNRPERYG
jgi:hypothetical protein